jgi:hypothetical protein
MSKETYDQYLNAQRKMDRHGALLVLLTAAFIHIIINVFAYVNNDPFYKVEAPILTAISIIAIIVGLKLFSHKEH